MNKVLRNPAAKLDYRWTMAIAAPDRPRRRYAAGSIGPSPDAEGISHA